VDEDTVTSEDLEDILTFHRVESDLSQSEQFFATFNYAIDKVLSRIVEAAKHEEENRL